MRHIILISCVSRKLPHRAPAEQLYVSPLFKLNLRYARQLEADAIFILSAKHGLLGLDEQVQPYDTTLNTMPAQVRKAWAEQVLAALRERTDLERDRFTLLAGRAYRSYLMPHLRHASVPLQGLGIGRQLQFLCHQVNDR